VSTIDQERQVLEQLVPQLEAEGFTVYLEPSRQMLPAFMEGYTPDVIALRSDKKLAFEIVVEGPSSTEKEQRLKHRFDKAKDWELRLLYARPVSKKIELPVMADDAIDASIASAEGLASTQQFKAAFLIAWATFEALGRALNPHDFARPQTPTRLIEILASKGFVTPSEADLLRRLATTRNQFIHGSLDEVVDRVELEEFILILRTLRLLTDADRQ
jgi:REase_AHJR-like